METSIRSALKSQYKAALTMLKESIDSCPDDLWTETGSLPPYWQVVYHTLFFTHLYLSQSEAEFVPWDKCRNDNHMMGPTPWPPYETPAPGIPYTKSEIYELFELVNSIVDQSVDAIDIMRQDSGFHWYPIPKLNHAFVNIRHIMMHVGQLDTRLRQHNIKDIDWKA